jgi:hypothetical protein
MRHIVGWYCGYYNWHRDDGALLLGGSGEQSGHPHQVPGRAPAAGVAHARGAPPPPPRH